MDRDQAARNLEVIRTLMERSALYRRALAPLMFLAGCAGVAGAIGSHFLAVDSTPEAFVKYWFGLSAIAIAGSLLLSRIQALRAREPFWSPPSRRVVQALVPPLAVGCACGIAAARTGMAAWILASLWLALYGCALHAAGFFTTRGIKLFGWIMILLGGLAYGLFLIQWEPVKSLTASDLMGIGFGLTHLAYGVYLRVTESRPGAPES